MDVDDENEQTAASEEVPTAPTGDGTLNFSLTDENVTSAFLNRTLRSSVISSTLSFLSKNVAKVLKNHEFLEWCKGKNVKLQQR